MKTYKVIFMAFAIMVLGAFVITSCSDENQETTNPKLVFREFNAAEAQMAEILQIRYGIHMGVLENEDYEFTLGNGRKIIMRNIGNQILITGSGINNESYIFEQLSKEQIDNLDNESEFLLGSNTLKREFISSINDVSNLLPEQQAMANPCSQHPANETFNECFKREIEAYCDGFVGCVSLALYPISISILIAAHCAAC